MIASGEALWVASQCISEVDHTGFDDGLNVKDKEQRGARNDSWAPALSNGEGAEATGGGAIPKRKEGTKQLLLRGAVKSLQPPLFYKYRN